MNTASLGKVYKNGEVIVHQGAVEDCMYVIQQGKVEVVQDAAGREMHLAVLDEGDFFGEMALFERERRVATVRALGEAAVLTVDKKVFLKRVHEDPVIAYRILQKMSHRIRVANAQLARMKASTSSSLPSPEALDQRQRIAAPGQ
jgi:CRP-like cAMP-binding protein